MSVRIEKVAKLTPLLLQRLNTLDKLLFDEDDVYPKADAQWWLAYDPYGPIAFAGVKIWAPDNCAYLCRAGVLKTARGCNLQRRLIDVRLRWAREQNAVGAYTYTMPWNHASSNNLIKAGFQLWTPGYQWAGKDVLYWWHGLGKYPTPR